MSKRLFVGNVSPQVTEDQLRRFFSAAGEVVQVSIPLDRESARPRGFAFVEFANVDEAERALEIFDDAEFEGRRLRPRIAFEDRGREAPKWRRDRPRRGAPEAEDDVDEPSAWSGFGGDDYSAERERGKARKKGKHGSDRKRGQGTRRYIE